MKYKKFRPLVKEQERCKEISKLKLYANRPSLSELFQGKDKRGKEEQMHQACQEYGYTLKEIAEYLAVHYTTVSKAIKRLKMKKTDQSRTYPIKIMY